MRHAQRVRQLNPQRQYLFCAQRFPVYELAKRLAIDEFHGDKGLALIFTCVINGADARMIQCGRGLDFASESL
jgi:hypothetical protein